MHAPVLLHLGALHPFELALVLLVAVAPFVVLGVVVVVLRRRAVEEEEQARRTEQDQPAEDA